MKYSNLETFEKFGFLINLIYKMYSNFLVQYKHPYNISFLWNFGFLSGIFLAIQIVTGLLLTMSYTAHIQFAFHSIYNIMNELNYGWVMRYFHLNIASFFFLAVYIHIFKAIYYSSYKQSRSVVWFIGIIIYILMMGTAFLGYVLPWGQMSFWAATVITNFITVIPIFGLDVVQWVWAGFSINNATLTRFFSLHYLLPFLILVFVLLHLTILHIISIKGNNPLGLHTSDDNKITFDPYSYIKDYYYLIAFLIIVIIVIFWFPESLNHPDNYIKANPLSTPPHIVPEWYFLPFYAILRCISNKMYGIIVMFLCIIMFFFLPLMNRNKIKSSLFHFINKQKNWFLIVNLTYLGILGYNSPIFPYVEVGLICTHLHLFYFILLLLVAITLNKMYYNRTLVQNTYNITSPYMIYYGERNECI